MGPYMSRSPPLPPLSALRAFEAAARHLSFSKAADELSVTPGAISHQIKALEDYLKINLFHRRPGALELTEAGAALAPGLIRGFREIHAAVDSFVEYDLGGLLTVSATPSLAALWLVPRLSRFYSQHPEIDVRLDANAELVDFARDDVDIAIRYGPGGYEGLKSELLFEHCVTPLCSPALIERKPVRSPDDLSRHSLLHVEWRSMADGMPNWAMWLKAAGATRVDPTRGLRFNDGNLALQAALAGQGVALLDESLARPHIREGRLVRPFDINIAGPGRFAFWIVGPERTWRKPKIKAFRAWLMAEVRASHDGTGAECHA
jgi:LysR family transcriptional regulator, glycine cleavage system transcriptional activator